ncbi:hypothetical protein [Nocardia amikacinitolerans]|uniref:hypothetical protein n=1 Tax=Nocardia amikacinitolerans TaxID=756689 RepID=UPI0020A60C3C|nr:hypothetical protein [Nocardia amikacinitolerans]
MTRQQLPLATGPTTVRLLLAATAEYSGGDRLMPRVSVGSELRKRCADAVRPVIVHLVFQWPVIC